MTGTANHETPGTGGDQGSRPPQAEVIQLDRRARRVASGPGDGQRRPRSGIHLRSARARPDPPDLGALAKDAVIGFLHDASAATAERAATRAETAVPGTSAAATVGTGVLNGPDEADGIDAESAAWRAASAGMATLDRIEAAAASIEADIHAALQRQADLQAGAGAAAEAAVSAAASAWQAAGTAVEADSRVRVAARRVEHYVTITVIMLIIAMIILVVGASASF